MPDKPFRSGADEAERLRLQLAKERALAEELRVELVVRTQEPVDLREAVANLDRELTERDDEIECLRRMVREGETWRREMETWRRETEASLMRGIEALRAELDEIKSTRLWRTGQSYWRLKARLRRGST